jgi:hypothetical protein
MSLDRFISLWMDPDYPPRRISEPELAAVESRFDFEFPLEYREAALRHGLVSPTIALLDVIVDDEHHMADLSQMLPADEMISRTEDWRDMGLPLDMVAYATDCGGNLFCFRTDGSPNIFYFDHDFGTLETVAPSFTAWIEAYCAIAPEREG